MKSIVTLTLCFLITLVLEAQDVRVTNTLKFKSGVYLSLESFQKNEPDYSWNELIPSVYVNEQRYVAHVEYIKKRKDEGGSFVAIPIDQIWGFTVNGLPYIRIYNSSKKLTHFAGLRTRGKLCYFTYEGYEAERVPMTVYDPITQKAMHTQYIENQKEVVFKRVLLFEEGTIEVLNWENFEQWIIDDARLSKTMGSMNELDKKNKLYKSMLIYNDRNPIYLKH